VNAIDLLATRLILALLIDDRCESDFMVNQVREESGLDPCRFSLALATAIEAANWWGSDPARRQYARDMLSDRIAELSGVPA